MDFNVVSQQEAAAFQRELDSIMDEICLYFSLPAGLTEEETDAQILAQSQRYLAGPGALPCEAVVADNLFFRCRLIGCTPEQIAQAMGLPVDVVLDYETGVRSIAEHQEEFLRLATVYQYHLLTVRDVFLYGSGYHEAFAGAPGWPDKSALSLCKNPFFPA